MATEKVIMITIAPDGSDAKIEPIKGFKDGSCLKETLALEQGLGTVTNRTKKPEALINPEKEKGVTVKR